MEANGDSGSIPRRTAIVGIGVVGVAIVGATATLASPSWARPALKEVIGAPAAAASGGSVEFAAVFLRTYDDYELGITYHVYDLAINVEGRGPSTLLAVPTAASGVADDPIAFHYSGGSVRVQILIPWVRPYRLDLFTVADPAGVGVLLATTIPS